MTRTIFASTVLALLYAGSMTASAAPSQGSDVRDANEVRLAHQNLAGMRASAPKPPTVFPSRRPQPYPYNFHETDGLSRNPNDCAVWGCVDNN
jgi:hypothetical protein